MAVCRSSSRPASASRDQTPMPRPGPRSWTASWWPRGFSRPEAGDLPAPVAVGGVGEAVVEAVGPAVPELPALRGEHVPTPAVRAGHIPPLPPRRHLRDARLHGLAVGHRTALVRRPGGQLAGPRPAGPVGVG